MWMGIIESIEDLNRTKSKGSDNFPLSGSQGLGLGLNHTTGCPGSSVTNGRSLEFSVSMIM